jgi:hypothetical protein
MNKSIPFALLLSFKAYNLATSEDYTKNVCLKYVGHIGQLLI